jgi:hypothetical protein
MSTILVKEVPILIHMFLGLPDPSLFFKDPELDSDPSINKQEKSEKPRFLLFCDFFLTFYQ